MPIGWPHLQAYAGIAPPTQFLNPLETPPSHSDRSVMGAAHNAGNHPQTTASALEHGADIIEIDVVSVRGQLSAGRVQPLPWLAQWLFRGPTLAEAMADSAAAPVVKLDLQQNDRQLLDQLVVFLGQYPTSRRVMISSRDPAALQYLRPRLPAVSLLLSIASPDAVARVRSDPPLIPAIDGLSVFQGLITPSLVGWAHSRGLVVLAWTVNEGQRLDELLALGVDGITTQNLAVLDALRGPNLRSTGA